MTVNNLHHPGHYICKAYYNIENE